MATAYTVHVTPADVGLYRLSGQTDAAAAKTTELLQADLASHHVYFNQEGFHNHIVHHLLSLFGTGAGPDALQKGYDENASYQRPALDPHDGVPDRLAREEDADAAAGSRDPEWWARTAGQYLGKEQYYPDFLAFFQAEIQRRPGGYQEVLNEFLFKGDDKADDMLLRLFAGFLHPLIQLLYGLEWRQPAIIAEALAQTAIHTTNLAPLLLPAEEKANTASPSPVAATYSLQSLYDSVHTSAELRASVKMSDANKLLDGVAARAPGPMTDIAARVRIPASQDDIDARTLEMYNAAVQVALSAALNPPVQGKVPKVDFFLMHHVNSAPFFLTVNAQDWIPLRAKARLLEWKIRVDLMQYAARASPAQGPVSIAEYESRDPRGLDDLFQSIHILPDDGHVIKLLRAVAICNQLTTKALSSPSASENHKLQKLWLPLRDQDHWSRAYNLVYDAATGDGPTWLRSTGLVEAWKDVPNKV